MYYQTTHFLQHLITLRNLQSKFIAVVAVSIITLHGHATTNSSEPIATLNFTDPEWLSTIDPPWHSRLQTTQLRPTPDAPLFTTSLQVNYPQGSVGPEQGGAQFPMLFEKWQGLQPLYRSLTLEYCLKFNDGFDFRKGGKLPGLMGGGDSWSRSGGQQPNGANGWTLRYMWRSEGRAVIYAYLPASPNGRYGNQPWGQDIELYKRFKPGQWHCLKQSVTINELGKEDGQLRVWFDGELVLDRSDITYRLEDTPQGFIGGVYFSSFHGGNTADWAPQQDSTALFNGFRIYE